MPNQIAITQRISHLQTEKACQITDSIIEKLTAQNYQAVLSADFIQKMCAHFHLSVTDFALYCVPVAACYALTPVSNFNVGAVAIGLSGNFYFGANQEFAHLSMQQTVHAEQSAISHAWLAGEKGITDVAVNYTPCGHCRQFMNELNSAKTLKIHLPHSQDNLLQRYLPDGFSPKDLNIEKVLFDEQYHGFSVESQDPVAQVALQAANQSYAPYSLALSGVALQLPNKIIAGRYAENAAFNPSFLPLQSALNFRRLQGLSNEPILRVILAEKKAVLSHRFITENLLQELGLTLEYIAL